MRATQNVIFIEFELCVKFMGIYVKFTKTIGQKFRKFLFFV